MPNLLAIDNGTQSVKAILFDPRGNLLAKSQVPFEPYFSDVPGWAEQHPHVFWDAVCQACQGPLAAGRCRQIQHCCRMRSPPSAPP